MDSGAYLSHAPASPVAVVEIQSRASRHLEIAAILAARPGGVIATRDDGDTEIGLGAAHGNPLRVGRCPLTNTSSITAVYSPSSISTARRFHHCTDRRHQFDANLQRGVTNSYDAITWSLPGGFLDNNTRLPGAPNRALNRRQATC